MSQITENTIIFKPEAEAVFLRDVEANKDYKIQIDYVQNDVKSLRTRILWCMCLIATATCLGKWVDANSVVRN